MFWLSQCRLAALVMLPLALMFFLSQCSIIYHKKIDWVSVTKQDISDMYAKIMLNHPGPVDDKNPKFLHLLNASKLDAIKKANEVSSFSGYKAVLQSFTNKFHDGHLGVVFFDIEKDVLWPGFLVRYANNQLIVTTLKNKQSELHDGDRLISCDGALSEDFLSRQLELYGNPNLPASKRQVSYRLFIDQGDPFNHRPRRCTFLSRKNNSIIKMHLKWRKIGYKKLIGMLEKLKYPSGRKSSFRRIDRGSFLLSLPTFNPSSTQEKKLNSMLVEIAKARPSLQKSKVIIIDVRGNQGGNSYWGELFARAIWGEAFVAFYASKLESGTYVDWRVSRANYRHLKNSLRSIKAQFKESSQEYQHLNAVIKKFKNALSKKQDLYREYGVSKTSLNKEIDSPVTAEVYVITDGRCGSACLDFLDLILPMPNVTQVGQETFADSFYMEARPLILPSGLAMLVLPIKVYRGRKRGSNAFYSPRYRLDTFNLSDQKITMKINRLVDGAGSKTLGDDS